MSRCFPCSCQYFVRCLTDLKYAEKIMLGCNRKVLVCGLPLSVRTRHQMNGIVCQATTCQLSCEHVSQLAYFLVLSQWTLQSFCAHSLRWTTTTTSCNAMNVWKTGMQSWNPSTTPPVRSSTHPAVTATSQQKAHPIGNHLRHQTTRPCSRWLCVSITSGELVVAAAAHVRPTKQQDAAQHTWNTIVEHQKV